jgi:hypothetical protein
MGYTAVHKSPIIKELIGVIQVEGMYELVLKSSRVIDVGERNIVMATKDYGRGKPRFIINLPTTRNDLWRYLWEKKVTVKVFIEIPEEALKVKSSEDVK